MFICIFRFTSLSIRKVKFLVRRGCGAIVPRDSALGTVAGHYRGNCTVGSGVVAIVPPRYCPWHNRQALSPELYRESFEWRDGAPAIVPLAQSPGTIAGGV
ncbi:hypothetical protein L6452_32816 [Arctium lappa]|uniref:Uncharacterized protein n=1 Tax=Arctium lappa TaxID=4217 RepID=A0ACB8Z5K3_ARCLA|nr:hypothetical protein L6452_32816 [Arctium lappa]